MTNTPARRNHAARALLHRWFAFLETEWGDIEGHLEMFEPTVRLTGRRGAISFARDRDSLRTWFDAVPDPTSSHHLLHAVWTDTGPDAGALSFVVAYETPTPDGVAGAIIGYDTVVTFQVGNARFASLDKTPVLPNTSSVYRPSWSTHRVSALLHAALSDPENNTEVVAALGVPGEGDELEVWAPSAAPRSRYVAEVTLRRMAMDTRMVRLSFGDAADATYPTLIPAEAHLDASAATSIRTP